MTQSARKYRGPRDFAAFTWNAARYRYGPGPARTLRRSRADLVRQFNARKVVLTVTAGRSGSDALTHRIGLVPGVTSIHEPMPHYRYILREAQHDPMLAARFFAGVKVPALLEYGTPAVAESNHLFGKGFFEPCLAMGFRPALVFLRRDAKANAISTLRKNSVPDRTVAGQRYVISPWDRPYLPIEGARELSDFQLCYWYCLEMHLRHDLYLKVCRDRGIDHFVLETTELNDGARLEEMMRALGLAGAETDLSALGGEEVTKVVNAISSRNRTAPDADLDAEIAGVEDRLGTPAGVDEVERRIETIRRGLEA